jgi:nucleoside-diphosphate-sugar epimerase
MGQNRTEDRTRASLSLNLLPYMLSKAKAERHIRDSGLPFTTLRLPPLLGRGDTYLSPAIVPRLLDGSFFMNGPGERLVSLMVVRNFPPVIRAILEQGPLNGAYNCCDHHVPFRELAAEYARRLNVPFHPRKEPLIKLAVRFHDKAFLLLLTFSRFGAHYPDDKLHARVPHMHAHDWREGVEDACGPYLERLPIRI